ncbi:MAG: hypothetical protein PW788_02100 [Micavibrio sp.]|nr:hypothetical protein [Micavibrio sp.]
MADKRPEKRSLRKDFARAARNFVLAPVMAIAALNGAGAPFAKAADIQSTPDTSAQQLAPLQPMHDAVIVPRVRAEKSGSGEKLTYDQQVFSYNAPKLQTPSPDEAKKIDGMNAEERKEYYMKKLCFTAGNTPAAGAAQQEQIASALAILSSLPVTGKPLVDNAVASHVQFCGLPRLPLGIGAQYLPGSDAIISGPDAMKAAFTLHMAHEMLHAAQDGNHLLNYETAWDIQSRVARNLSIEAAAYATEFMVAMEAKQAGDASYWVYMEVRFHNTPAGEETLRMVEKSYQDVIAAGGTKDTALRAVGQTAWQRVFENDEWRNFYLNLELTNYMADIAGGSFHRVEDIHHNGFDAAKVAKAGQVGGNASFTANVTFPDFDSLMARNEKMRWAYQAAEIARLKQMDGDNDKAVETLKAAALKDNNPYLEVDIIAAWQRASNDSWDRKPGNFLQFLYQYLDADLPVQTFPVKDAAPIIITPLPPLPAVPQADTAPAAPPVVAKPAPQRPAA